MNSSVLIIYIYIYIYYMYVAFKCMVVWLQEDPNGADHWGSWPAAEKAWRVSS